MKRHFRSVLALAVIFTLGNVAGGIWAAAMGERQHTMLHIVLTVAGAAAISQIMARRRADTSPSEAQLLGAQPRELTSRLSNLEQSLDAIALEVERVGEGQRYMTRLFAERERHDQPR